MTRTATLTTHSAVRITSAPALLATWWDAADAEGHALIENVAVEDIIRLVARHGALETEVAAAPRDLREFIGRHCASFAADPAASWVIGRSIPAVRTTSAVANRMLERFRRMAGSPP